MRKDRGIMKKYEINPINKTFIYGTTPIYINTLNAMGDKSRRSGGFAFNRF